VQIEERGSGLQLVETRLDQFEERLTTWATVEEQIARSLEQISAREATVETLQADLNRMFAMAEKTTAEVRAITSAQREIQDSRRFLDQVTSQLREIRGMTTALDERKREMAQAETRLARAEALLADVRFNVSALQGQKVIVDHAVEKAGSLQFLLKQAESMIEGLREERDVTARVHAAITAIDPDEREERRVPDRAQEAVAASAEDEEPEVAEQVA
jgi:DNA repair exonuclease SbcCD ATPase subunit